MPVIPEYLKNDNAKWEIVHRWQPDIRAWELAKTAFSQIKTNIYRNTYPLSYDQALQRAEKNTSCGYLYKQMGFSTKGEVLSYFKDELRVIIDEIAAGVNHLSIWEMAPKVEIRSLQKLIHEDETKRKQRTFMVADTLAYIVGLMLYSEQNDAQTALCNDKSDWCGVGISIFNGGWNNLARNLLSVSNEFIACDETAMEACITLELQNVIYTARHDQLPDSHQALATWYLYTNQHGLVHDGFGNICQKVGGNSTGQVNTIHENCDGGTLKKLYHLAKGCEDAEELVLLYRSTGVKQVGDDDVIPYQSCWDGLIESSAELGFETKIEAWRVPLSELTFLNFKFIFDIPAMMYTFQPNFDKLFSGLFLYRKSNSWRLTLARLFAMKILCYNDKSRYAEVQYYIDYIKNHHTLDIEGETAFDSVITVNSLFSQDKTSREIADLLFNLESSGSFNL